MKRGRRGTRFAEPEPGRGQRAHRPTPLVLTKRKTKGSLYSAPPLIVETILTTEHSEGQIRKADGERLSGDGAARLVGVARVPRVDDSRDFFTNFFLQLPTDALAVMDARFEFE